MATIPAGGKATVAARFRVGVTPQALLKGRGLLDRDAYDLTLWLAVAPGFQLPIYLF